MAEQRWTRDELVTLAMALEEFRETGRPDLAERVNVLLRRAVAGDEFVLGPAGGEQPEREPGTDLAGVPLDQTVEQLEGEQEYMIWDGERPILTLADRVVDAAERAWGELFPAKAFPAALGDAIHGAVQVEQPEGEQPEAWKLSDEALVQACRANHLSGRTAELVGELLNRFEQDNSTVP